MRKYPILLLFAFMQVKTIAQSRDSLMLRRIVNDVMINGQAYENLRFICKTIGHRLTGSPAADKAIAETMRMLKQAGADTVYLQPCLVPHWERGATEEGWIALPDGTKKQLKLCALGNSYATPAGGLEAGIVEVKSMDDLHRLGTKNVSGKIVFYNIEMTPTHINTFHAYGTCGDGRRIGPAEAARYGAIAVIVRSLASNPDDYPHTGATRYNDSFPKIPAVAVSTNDANFISKQLKQHRDLQAWFRTSCRFLTDKISYNVIGELRGRLFPNEIISVGGHLDSWDLGEGAHDDGAGCVQSIELIRVFKALAIQPGRTIRAVMFMNEENGLKGAQAYFDSARAKNEKHLFALESDAGGFTPRGFSFETDDSRMKKFEEWSKWFTEYGAGEFKRGGGGADISQLKKLGAVLCGLRPDSQRYFDVHHAATDTFETVSRRELHLGAAVMAAIIWLVDVNGL